MNAAEKKADFARQLREIHKCQGKGHQNSNRFCLVKTQVLPPDQHHPISHADIALWSNLLVRILIAYCSLPVTTAAHIYHPLLGRRRSFIPPRAPRIHCSCSCSYCREPWTIRSECGARAGPSWRCRGARSCSGSAVAASDPKCPSVAELSSHGAPTSSFHLTPKSSSSLC